MAAACSNDVGMQSDNEDDRSVQSDTNNSSSGDDMQEMEEEEDSKMPAIENLIQQQSPKNAQPESPAVDPAFDTPLQVQNSENVQPMPQLSMKVPHISSVLCKYESVSSVTMTLKFDEALHSDTDEDDEVSTSNNDEDVIFGGDSSSITFDEPESVGTSEESSDTESSTAVSVQVASTPATSSIQVSTQPTSILDLREFTHTPYLFQHNNDSVVAIGSKLRLVPASCGVISMYLADSDTCVGTIIDTMTRHSTIIHFSNILLLSVEATLVSRNQRGGAIRVDYHANHGALPTTIIEKLSSIFQPECLSTLKSLTHSSSKRTHQTREVQLRFFLQRNKANMGEQLIGKQVQFQPMFSGDVIRVLDDSGNILGDLSYAPNRPLCHILNSMSDLPFIINKAMIVSEKDYLKPDDNLAPLRIWFTSNPDVESTAVFDELARLFGTKYWKPEYSNNSNSNKKQKQ